ncbi:MAG: hypothetical protein HY319_21555 [Armatimonadetes bacterium]|nr:hypothetical protein [Armatimonadota bacterium]
MVVRSVYTPALFGPVVRPALASGTPAATDTVELTGSKKKIHWGNLAFLAGTTAVGALAGASAGLHTGLLPELMGWMLLPGATLSGAVLGGVAAEALKLDNQSTLLGGALWGAILGGAAGVAQAYFGGDVAAPVLAVTMGLTGGLTGLGLGARLLGR